MWKLKINTPNDEVYSTIITNTTAIDFDTTSITKTVYGTAETTHDTNKKKIDDETTNSVRKLCARSAVVAVLAYLLLFIYLFSIVYHHSRWQKSIRKQSETEKFLFYISDVHSVNFACVPVCESASSFSFNVLVNVLLYVSLSVCACTSRDNTDPGKLWTVLQVSISREKREREKKRHNSYMKQ